MKKFIKRNSTPTGFTDETFDASKDYGAGNYAYVQFFLKTPHYTYEHGWDKQEHKDAFWKSIHGLLETLNWYTKKDADFGFMYNFMEEMHINPEVITALVLKNHIGQIAHCLEFSHEFTLKKVIIHEDRWSGDIEEYKNYYLKKNHAAIKDEILDILNIRKCTLRPAFSSMSIIDLTEEVFRTKFLRYGMHVGWGCNMPEIECIQQCIDELAAENKVVYENEWKSRVKAA